MLARVSVRGASFIERNIAPNLIAFTHDTWLHSNMTGYLLLLKAIGNKNK
jgi:hypothetical protein